MQSVIFAPGFAGTYLYDAGAPSTRVWVDYTSLLLGKTRQLELAPDGVSPLPPYGVSLNAGEPYPAYYATALEMLADQLGRDTYHVHAHGFDFRLRIRDQGRILADRIRDQVTPAEPCTIVGHSQGGLLGRAAWADLVRTGQQSLVRRLICLGTPHEGSYSIVSFMTGFDDSAGNVALLDALGSAMYSGTGLYEGLLPLSFSGVAAIARSWPACYELLPMLDGADAAGDLLRVNLYDAGNWPFLNHPPQSWLDYARYDFQPWLRAAASIPPPDVLTCVVSRGFATRATLRLPFYWGPRVTFGETGEGDSIATQASATLADCRLYECALIHYDLTRQLVYNGALAMLIKEQGETPPPPPIVGTTPQVAVSLMSAPPTPFALAAGPDP